jgi:hypothetical protein
MEHFAGDNLWLGVMGDMIWDIRNAPSAITWKSFQRSKYSYNYSAIPSVEEEEMLNGSLEMNIPTKPGTKLYIAHNGRTPPINGTNYHAYCFPGISIDDCRTINDLIKRVNDVVKKKITKEDPTFGRLIGGNASISILQLLRNDVYFTGKIAIVDEGVWVIKFDREIRG